MQTQQTQQALRVPTATVAGLPSAASSSDLVRLYISPLTPTLLSSYLSPALVRQATNISYHGIETFPEKSFGFVDLPSMEAQKLKNKLHGSILKGAKVHVESATSEKRKKRNEVDPENIPETATTGEFRPRPKKKARKERDIDAVLDGVVLPENRKVKRGWTEPLKIEKQKKDRKVKEQSKDKKKKLQEKSLYSKEPELLFRTTLPPNAGPIDKKSSKKNKKSNRSDREVVVHEFEKSQKHASFLRNSSTTKSGKNATEYLEGKGWVDEDGNIVESEKKNSKHEREKVDEHILSLDNVLAVKSERNAQVKVPRTKILREQSPSISEEDTSESDNGDESSSVVSSSSELSESSTSTNSSLASRPSKSASPQSNTPQPTPADTEDPAQVHPLEALFKRPQTSSAGPEKHKLAPINTSFTFFENDDMELEDAEEVPDASRLSINVPQTPFTRQDLQWRGIRSAAPTPDTAAIGRKHRAPWRDPSEEDNSENAHGGRYGAGAFAEEDQEDEYQGHDTPMGNRKTKTLSTHNENDEEQESEYSKWYWENRSITNQAWKQQRREAQKVKKKSENKRGDRRV